MSLKSQQVLLLAFALLIGQAHLAPLEEEDVTSVSDNFTRNRSRTDPGDGSMRNSKRDESTTELPEFTSYRNTTTFTCYGKVTGYYADVKLNCRVYHFCTQMDSIGETSYQRMSYICLENSVFDQKDLNCVSESELKVPCDKAEAEYESSNKQFDAKEDSQPSISDNLAANIMMNPITRFIAG